MRIATVPTALAWLALASISSAAAPESVVLRARQRPGDAYRLSLATTTRTEAASLGAEGERLGEDARLLYNASVVVLAVDEAGRPIRERHESVRVVLERGGRTESLFARDAAFEVRREDGVRLHVGGQRVDRRIERIVARMLESQLEHSLEAEMIEPGRPVAAGETWALDPELARRFLRERGVRVIEFARAPTATIERLDGENRPGELSLRYAIPVRWFELERLPANARPANSEALFEGRVRFAPEPSGAPVGRTSSLTLRLRGVTAPGVAIAAPAAWHLERSVRSDQRVERVVAREAAVPDAVVADAR
jgi:hypothetical protein